jgi:glucose-6-phosphate 1-dehydrogenase
MRRSRVADAGTHRSDAFVFFGATGDLSRKQIYPALAGLTAAGELDMPVIAVARALDSADGIRALIKDSLMAHDAFDQATFDRLSARIVFVPGDYADPDTFQRLRAALGSARHPLHYLAIPPSLFRTVIKGIDAIGQARTARVIVEKPFGRSLETARELNRALHVAFDESSIFRIDHYLGKEPVQNLLYFRFANTFLEPVWNGRYIERVTVTMSEKFGVNGRGAFYDSVGAVRDVVQNHLLQITALAAMEPPKDDTLEAMREARTAVLEAVSPLTKDDVVFGQYRGYLDEPGVEPGSTVETFASVTLHINTPRWQGVPFVLRTGKCLNETVSEVTAEFREPATHVFFDTDDAARNAITFRLSPDVYTAIDARAKVPGEAMRGERTTLVARAADGHDGHTHGPAMPPYQRLIGDALEGDRTLFTTERGINAAWRIVDPIVNAGIPVRAYAPGASVETIERTLFFSTGG